VIRVSIAAGSELIRIGLETLIRGHSEFELAGNSGYTYVQAVGTGADVVIATESEINLADAELNLSAVPTVLLSEQHDADLVAQALRLGVRAVLPVYTQPTELIAAIHAVAAGLITLRPADVDLVIPEPIREDPSSDGTGHLSPRELEILQMLAAGLANKEIAWKLGISEHTAKFHVASIFNKLNAGSRAQAVAIGIRRGLIAI
jgi:DNA-binding NarL/FixJ family response regulator